MVKFAKKYPCIGILQQEAHARDIWPIGYGDHALASTYDIPSRISNAKTLLQRYPDLKTDIGWYVDIPNRSWYHVGGSFNSQMNAWPHRYFIFSRTGKLLFRTEHHDGNIGEHYILFQDLIDWIANENVSVKLSGNV